MISFNSDYKNYINIKNLDKSGKSPWNFYQFNINLSKTIVRLDSLFEVSQGLVTGADKVTKKHIANLKVKQDQLGRGIFILQENVDFKDGNKLKINGNWITLKNEDLKFIKPYVRPDNLKKWFVSSAETYVIHIGNRKPTKTIIEYLKQFATVLLNRSTTIEEGTIITLKDFRKFSLEEIKTYYSSAG
ncbi:MAG: hypothetical protein ACXAC2_25750, partial [Candidatus Kariarchaeaceae archaeon]